MRLMQLLAYFQSLSKAWHATDNELREADLSEQVLTSILTMRTKIDLDVEMRKVKSVGASIITLMDEDYPANLRRIADPPSVLYVKGDLLPTDELALAVVGTRKATRYGRDAAHRMSLWLAKNDVTIVSGLAQGIDAAAHQGALDANGRTIAVLGCGIDQIYPQENEKLAHDIMRKWCVNQ